MTKSWKEYRYTQYKQNSNHLTPRSLETSIAEELRYDEIKESLLDDFYEFGYFPYYRHGIDPVLDDWVLELEFPLPDTERAPSRCCHTFKHLDCNQGVEDAWTASHFVP